MIEDGHIPKWIRDFYRVQRGVIDMEKEDMKMNENLSCGYCIHGDVCVVNHFLGEEEVTKVKDGIFDLMEEVGLSKKLVEAEIGEYIMMAVVCNCKKYKFDEGV